MKALTVVGARPQFVKAAIVSRALRAAGIVEVLVHTGQHYDPNMSEIFFRELEMDPPLYDLGVGSGPHGYQTGTILLGIEPIIVKETPNVVIVFGDTNSTLAGAVAAAKLGIPVAHVEAGLRSFNRGMPEELNRVVADHLSSILFVPTVAGEANLHREGIPGERIHLVGDVMYDAVLQFGAKAERESRILRKVGVAKGEYVLATVHRPDNVDNPRNLRIIHDALCRISKDERVIMPVHPRTRASLDRNGLGCVTEGLSMIDPVGYLDMLMLQKNARVIVTDSGGVQKEAFFAKVPCITIRTETEWGELVSAGWNRVVPPTDALAVARAVRGANPPERYDKQLYGDGHAAVRIAELLRALN